ncbi:MAG: preprotein translocase subunit SecG [Cyclobacteriaceae bacterium]
MYTLIIGVILFIAVLLILVVLAQNPKGGGLSSQFGGSGASQVMGVKKTGDLLEKLTWGFAIAILTLSIASNFFIEEPQDFVNSPNIENAQNQSTLPGPSLQQSTDANTQAPIEDLGLMDDDSASN